MAKTYGEQFNEALACKTKEEAASWMTKELERYWVEFNVPSGKAQEIILANLGYMAGYYDHATAKKIHKLFGATHPIFGGSNYHHTVTPEKAFAMGQRAGEKIKKGARG